jgi:hypothetical protein
MVFVPEALFSGINQQFSLQWSTMVNSSSLFFFLQFLFPPEIFFKVYIIGEAGLYVLYN